MSGLRQQGRAARARGSAGRPVTLPAPGEPRVVRLRPRATSRAWDHEPDALLRADELGLVLERPGRSDRRLLRAGAVSSASWRPGVTGDGGGLTLVPADGDGPALLLRDADWWDGRGSRPGTVPGWARDLAGVLGVRLAVQRRDEPPLGATVRSIGPVGSRSSGVLQVLYGLLGVAPLTWGLVLVAALDPVLPDVSRVLQPVAQLVSQTVALVGLVVIGALWWRGSRRVRGPLSVDVELAPASGGSSRTAAARLRLGARPGLLLVRDATGAESALPSSGASWTRTAGAVTVTAPDGVPVLTLPLATWAPDAERLAGLRDVLDLAGAVEVPSGSGPLLREQRLVPREVVVATCEVPGLPGWPWLAEAVFVNAFAVVGALLLTDMPAAHLLAAVQLAALATTALATVVARRNHLRGDDQPDTKRETSPHA